ncbi:FAD-dependent thymidylate synthase [Micromonospora krabiensis]|uniref:FAD-dependent thymidylate synthase n=1 Tax=Micromonospora krabiensis TaxID=307121 RepID=A0A1C3N5V2_9ACTN|nr:FAD-dependent thymidylate synthase [Micromonospora krabiensis]SBV27957.1 thymidylate synthase (FAD) [Micromonospora krabiensis]
MRVLLIAHTHIERDIPGYVSHAVASTEPWVFETHADELVEQGGRLCYLSWNRPNPATATNKGYVANIIEKGHFSVLEHASATFYIDGVTRNFTHELIRHRHLSFSEVSQRYVDAGAFEFVEHPGLAPVSDPVRYWMQEAVENAFDAYGTLVDDLNEQGYLRKEARQAARHVLPGGTETKILVTGNLRAWRDVLRKRLELDANGEPLADLEFYQVAREILIELKRIAPNAFQDFEVPA